uniref:hypothetical protein n=1 Tax=Pseudoalteromonas mariniglutinosa TaxID=206042 RepID=UPI00387F657E
MSLTIYKCARISQQSHADQQLIAQLETRIALDIPRLDLANIFFEHSANQDAINYYIKQLNEQSNSRTVQVMAIDDASVLQVDPTQQFVIRHLKTNEQSVAVAFLINQTWWRADDYFITMILLLAACGFTVWANAVKRFLQPRAEVPLFENSEVTEKARLIIDLKDKTLSRSDHLGLTIQLANKPLCFYLALIEFCIDHPDVVLNQNKDLPEALLELANKYFYRLVELGHTIRKRPNFTNSLEKTLSEIRAALDEVWQDNSELKERYYPPKAYGEGSRSRLHHYGLKSIRAVDIEVRGK